MVDKMAVLEPFILEAVMVGELLIAGAVAALVMGKKRLFFIALAAGLGMLLGAWIVSI